MSLLENHPSSPPELKVINGYHNTKTESPEGSKSLSKSTELRISESDLAKVSDVVIEQESLVEEEKGGLMEKEKRGTEITEESSSVEKGNVYADKRNTRGEGTAVRG